MTNERVAMTSNNTSWIRVATCRPASLSQDSAWILLGAIGAWVLWLLASMASTASAQEADRDQLHEPVYRVSKAPSDAGDTSATARPSRSTSKRRPAASESQLAAVSDDPSRSNRLASKAAGEAESARKTVPKTSHPLDPALKMARESLANIEQNVRDYTCTMVKRERVGEELLDHEFMNCKIRHASGSTPFSVYLGFRRPDTIRGREVIFVEGQHDGKLVAHEGGLKGRFLPTVHLLPNSALAMRGNRYPITEIGILTLTRRLIEKGERDRKLGECKVKLVNGAKIDGRSCTMLEVRHDEFREGLDFHLARVFMDDKYKVPIRYESYGFPRAEGGKPPLLEEYTYMNLKLNVGLSDSDFDIANPSYRF